MPFSCSLLIPYISGGLIFASKNTYPVKNPSVLQPNLYFKLSMNKLGLETYYDDYGLLKGFYSHIKVLTNIPVGFHMHSMVSCRQNLFSCKRRRPTCAIFRSRDSTNAPQFPLCRIFRGQFLIGQPTDVNF